MNTRYVMLLFYDIPNSNKQENNKYMRFRKYILSVGFVMLQESVYVKTIKTKDKYYLLKRDLILAGPTGSNIRSLLITENSYENIDIISGELSFKEKIVSKKTRILKL